MDKMVGFALDSNVFIVIKVCISCGLDWEKEWKGKDFDGENMTLYLITLMAESIEDIFGSFSSLSFTLVALSDPYLDKNSVWLSDPAPFYGNYGKISFDAKHLKTSLKESVLLGQYQMLL